MFLALVLAAATQDLRLEVVRQSLTGTHYRYQQYIGGLPVVGGEVNITVASDGTRTETKTLARSHAAASMREGEALHYVNVDGVARLTRRVVEDHVARYIDHNGVVVRRVPLFAPAKPARVFDPNPVTKLNAPGLEDSNDSAAAVPDAAYSDVTLERTNESGPLAGDYVRIVDIQNPAVPPADSGGSLVFNRSASGFEDVNAYFHIDQSQMYLQSLGYTGARAIAPYAVEVDTHAANGRDDSFFLSSETAGRGTIFFGEGGTDDAEDSDLVAHEYAHAIHEWISPGTFLGPVNTQARAMSEGFGDYWALSATYLAAISSGRDPFCFADWDARCSNDAASEQCGYPPGSDCLRRLDSSKTFADFSTVDSPGTEHRNGEIWSSALREIFVAMIARHGREAGKRLTDTIVVESLFGAQPNPTFASIARRMLAVDQLFTRGANQDLICAAMTARGLVESCALPRGELTLFQSPEQGAAVPDNLASGIVASLTISDARVIERLLVSVNIRHSNRGDLRLVLIAPDGTEVVLQNPSIDRAADINTTFGRDSNPIEPLDRFRGRSAAGVWRLRVSDVRILDTGVLLSWGLAIQFAGDQPAATRPRPTGSRRFIAAAASLSSNWVTDVRLFSERGTEAALIFTPSGSDGTSAFAAVTVNVPARTVVAFDNIVRTLFGTSGLGQIEIIGDVLATSRTYTRSSIGTYGQFIPAVPSSDASRFAFLPRLANNADFRTNIGFAETAGAAGVVRARFYEAGTLVATRTYTISPFGHVQDAVQGPDRLVAELEVIEGSAQILAYASVIDNTSNDAAFFAAAPPSDGLAPAISAMGAGGTHWRSELWITSGDWSLPFAPFHFRYTDAATGRILEIEARERSPNTVLLVASDAIAQLFQSPGTRGVLSLNDEGFSAAQERNPLYFTHRIYTTGPNGTYGQNVPFAVPSAATRDLLHIENTADYRTNLGAVADTAAVVRFVVFDAAGREVGRTERSVEPYRLVQFTLTERVVNGRVRVEVLDGRVYPYASIVDNRTGDPIFVPGQ